MKGQSYKTNPRVAPKSTATRPAPLRSGTATSKPGASRQNPRPPSAPSVSSGRAGSKAGSRTPTPRYNKGGMVKKGKAC